MKNNIKDNTSNLNQISSKKKLQEFERQKGKQELQKELQKAELQEEFGGRGGLEPTRYSDWESKGRVSDF